MVLHLAASSRKWLEGRVINGDDILLVIRADEDLQTIGRIQRIIEHLARPRGEPAPLDLVDWVQGEAERDPPTAPRDLTKENSRPVLPRREGDLLQRVRARDGHRHLGFARDDV